MSGKHVLVVNDDPALRGVLQTYLEDHGYAVETAENGREALTKLDQNVYDAVLLDFIMPEVDGLVVLRQLRQHHPSLPVMMMAGERHSQAAAESFVALGARACLFKPFDIQDVEQIMTCL